MRDLSRSMGPRTTVVHAPVMMVAASILSIGAGWERSAMPSMLRAWRGGWNAKFVPLIVDEAMRITRARSCYKERADSVVRKVRGLVVQMGRKHRCGRIMWIAELIVAFVRQKSDSRDRRRDEDILCSQK